MFGQTVYPNGGRYGPLSSPYLILLLMEAGEADVMVDDEFRFTLRQGECGAFYNRSSAVMTYRANVATDVSWLECRPTGAPEPLTETLAAMPRSIPASDNLKILQRLGVGLGERSTPHLNKLRNLIGEAVLSCYLNDALGSSEDSKAPQSTLRAFRYIENNFIEDIDLSALARISHVTPQHLIHSFKKHFAVTPMRHVWRLRAAKGARLLCDSNLSVSEIGYQCGYKSPYHFSRQIKSIYGRSPTELRKSGGYQEASDILEGGPELHFEKNGPLP